jgi:hypothetical protein
MKHTILLILLVFYAGICMSQDPNISQTVRGAITDRESNAPLLGVNVAIYVGEKLIGGSATDEHGEFRIEKVPVGRININRDGCRCIRDERSAGLWRQK